METPLQTKRVNALFIFLKTMLLLLEQMTIKFFSSSMKTKLSFIPIRNDKDSEIQTNSTRNFFSIALLLLSLFFVGNSFGQANGDYQTRNNGSWGSSSTWSKRVSGSWVNATDYPGQNSGAGVVTILDNDDVTLNVSPSNAISSLVMGGGSNDTNLNFNPSTTLNVTNAVTINAGTSNSRDKIIAVGSGTLNCGSMSFANTSNTTRNVEVTISTGTVTVSGNIVMSGASDENAIRFSGSGLLRVGSAISGGSLVASSGTVEYYGNGSGGTTSNQTIANYAYNNLETSGSGTKTLAGNTTANGVLTVSAGTTLALSSFTLGSPSSIVLENGGTASTISGTGLLTLGGNVTVNKISGSGLGALISCPVALTNASTRTFTVANETTTATDLTISGIISTTGAIIKAGLGNMVQSGNNTYSGGTTVNAGILSINSTTALGAVANDFTIASGAVANVTANVTVGDLTLGGVGTANGTWGFTGSGATYINTNYFTSTSRVTVSNNTRTNPTVTPTIGSYTYNGSSQGPNAATNTGTGTSYTFSYSGSGYGPTTTRPTTAGSYTVTVTVGATSDGFYNSASSSATAFAITKANSTITATGTTSFVYNGLAQGPTTSTSTGSTGAVTYSYSGVNPTVYSASTTRPIAVGTYQVIATLAADSNYSGAISSAYAFAINPGAFAKLQILLPGETVAPGTGSGKTGTPIAQVSGVAFTATVNAVDAFWNVVSDAPANTIAITTSDINDSHPANNNLSSGTRTFSITLKTVGSSTVTATNATNGLIIANTSPSVTVTPGIKTTNGDGNWNNPNTWSPSGVPYLSDQVYIISSHDVTVTANATCASINFTDENSSISVNSGMTLTVNGAVTLNSYNDDTDTSAEIRGLGTLNAGFLNVGLASVLNTTTDSDNNFDLRIASLNITGNLTIYNNDEFDGDANEPTVTVHSTCTLSADKLVMIQTGGGDGGSRIIEFNVNSGATVNLSGAPNPITISSEVDLDDDHVDFNFGSTSTINFNGTVTQNIPASISNSRIGGSTETSVPVNYGNLTINNTTGTTTSASTGRTINIAGNWTNNGVFNATGSTVNFNGNSTQAIAGTTATTFDDVTVGKTGGTLSVNTNAIVGDDLTFTRSGGTLSVSSSKILTVTDRLTLNNDDENSVTATITGAGTLTASTVIVGPLLDPDDNTRTTTLNSSISSFTIANNLEINSYYRSGDKNNGVFNLASGILTINGQIDTTNENSGNVSTFSMATGAQSGLLKLTGAMPFNLSGQGTSTMNLNGTSAIVEYLGSVPQTALGGVGITYRTLKINNSNSEVTLSGNASATTLDLTDGLLTTGANTMAILSGGSITNASAISYVNGKLNRTFTNTTPATFPVGKGGVYSPVVFNYVSNTNKTVTIEQFETGSPFSSSSISTTTFGARYWNITQSAIGTNYTVGLNNGGKTPLGSVVMLRKNNTTITLNNPTTFSSPNYTNSSAFSATVVSNDVALGETAIPLSITGVTGINNKIYDGNAIATAIGSPVLSGTILPGETVTLSGIPVYTFNNKNVGTGKSVTVSGLVLTGADAGAYSLPTNQIPGLTADISTTAIEVTANTNSKTFDNTVTSSALPSITSGALQGSDTFGFTQVYDDKNFGADKTLTPIGIVNDGNSGNNYAVTFITNNTGVITQKSLTISGATTTNKVYDGTDVATLTGGTLVGVISPNIVTLNKSAIFASANAGTWGITSTSTISGADAGNYILIQPTLASRTITKIALTITGTTTVDKEYDRTNTAILSDGILNGVLSGEDVTLVLSGRYASANAGGPYVITSTSTIIGNDIANYTLTQPTLSQRSITKVTLTIIGATTVDKAYNGNTIAIVTGSSLLGVVPGDVLTLTQSGIFPSKDAGGPYTITPNFSISGGAVANYILTQPILDNASIIPKVLTISGTSQNKVYDGTSNATLLGSGNLVGVVSGENVLLDLIVNYYSSSGVTVKDAGGPYVVTSTSTISSGDIATDIANYTLTQPTLTPRNISKIALTITGTTTVDKEYDRTNTAILSDGVLNGVLVGEDVSLVLSGRYASANAGGPYVMTSTSTIIGADSINYSLTQPSTLTPRNISKVTLTIEGATSVDKDYDGNTNTVVIGGSLIGVIQGDVLTLTQSGIYPTKNVGGPYSITPNFSIGGAAAVNYDLIQPILADVTINPKTLTIVGTTQNKMYDGNDVATLISGGLSGVVSGEDVVLDLVVNYASKNAGGPYTITSNSSISGSDIGNYTFVQPSILSPSRSITKIPLTITGVTASNKIYDGNRVASIDTSLTTLNGAIISGETVTINTANAIGTFDTKDIGIGKTVTMSNFILEGLDAVNYNVIQPTFTADITARTLTITANNQSKCAESSFSFVGTEFTRDYVVAGDVISVNLTSAGTDISALSGSYPIVASNAIGNGIDNYDITYVNGSLLVNPLPTATISVNNAAACQNDTEPLITFTGSNGTGTVRYEFTYKIGVLGLPLTVSSAPGVATATVSVPTGIARTADYILLSVKDLNTGCSQVQTGTASVIVGLCTSLMNGYRSATLSNLHAVFFAFSVPGATTYRFEITKVSDGTKTVINSSVRSLILSQLLAGSPTGLVTYATEYSIRVAVNNGGYAYGLAYSVFTPAKKTIMLGCGATLNKLQSVIAADLTPYATEFSFKVTRVGGGTTTIVQPGRIFYLTSLPDNELLGGAGLAKYNTSYSISAQARIDGDWTPESPSCTYTTPSPVTYMMQCGSTLAKLNSIIYADVAGQAAEYRFEVSGPGGTRTIDVPGAVRSFNLTQVSPAGVLGQTYSVRVAIRLTTGGPFQAYSAVCTYTTPLARMSAEELSSEIFNVKAFPNPFASHFSLDIESSSDDIVEMKVYDMIGRQLEVRKASVSELSVQEIGHNYPSGVYNVIVSQGDKVKSVRMVKR